MGEQVKRQPKTKPSRLSSSDSEKITQGWGKSCSIISRTSKRLRSLAAKHLFSVRYFLHLFLKGGLKLTRQFADAPARPYRCYHLQMLDSSFLTSIVLHAPRFQGNLFDSLRIRLRPLLPALTSTPEHLCPSKSQRSSNQDVMRTEGPSPASLDSCYIDRFLPRARTEPNSTLETGK